MFLLGYEKTCYAGQRSQPGFLNNVTRYTAVQIATLLMLAAKSKGKGKAILLQAWKGPAGGFQEVEAPRLQDNRHMKVVRLSALRTGRFYPQGNIPGTHLC